MDPQVLKKLNEARLNRKAVAVVTSLSDGRDRLVVEGSDVEGELGETLQQVFLMGKPRTLQVSGSEFFINIYLPPPRIVVIGAVHITQALAVIAKTAGFDLEVIDPRTAFATSERFGQTALFADWPEDVLAIRPLDAYCALVAVTHDPKIDDYPLLEALNSKCFYIGALGSKKTHAKRIERLENQGATVEQLDHIHSPIGLDIGAVSPQEIAVAIMAEIIVTFRTRGLGV